ncbi:unnamed protein product, partial [Mesorhabditis belari]|uniref:BHLH domain-containing protein n=1 Tax=Mesorhabditis belari TaxID=2138241 RepID=A0AAF3EIQ9_9BILA
MKLNKGTILKASCDYIRQLQKDRDSMIKQQQQQNKLENAAKHYADRVRSSSGFMSQLSDTTAAITSPLGWIHYGSDQFFGSSPQDYQTPQWRWRSYSPDSQRMHHGPFPDLITEWCLENNPLLHSDPLMSQAGGPSSNLAVR